MAFRRELSNDPASIWSRLGAYLLDALIVSPIFVVAFALAGYTNKTFDEMSELVSNNSGRFLGIMAGTSCVFLAYRVIMHRYYGQTLGKMATGIGVTVAGSSEPPAWDRLIIRELFVVFAQFIPVAGLYISMGDSISVFFNSKHRTWHDRASGTEVRRFSDV